MLPPIGGDDSVDCGGKRAKKPGTDEKEPDFAGVQAGRGSQGLPLFLAIVKLQSLPACSTYAPNMNPTRFATHPGLDCDQASGNSCRRRLAGSDFGLVFVVTLFFLHAFLLSDRSTKGEEPVGANATGEQIYAARCASCHGVRGEGGDEYPAPLTGIFSVGQLAKFIRQSMPKDAAEKCSSEESEKVATYIFEAFYSPLAQARNRPARIELSRLTVRQYRNAIADLIGSFREQPVWGDSRGLRAEYFKSRQMQDKERLVDRIDPQVFFDFSNGPPSEGEFDYHQFSIRWQGALLAPENGEYEIQLRSDQAVRLWLNNSKTPLIDGWVRSGENPVYRESIYLLGGRAYSLKIEFAKAKQGVDDSEKNKKKPPAKASIFLEWKRPGQSAIETIPERNLLPVRVPEVYVVDRPFPPDDRSIGYERGTAISKEWDQATTDAALEVATSVAERVDELAAAGNRSGDRTAKLRDFCLAFAERAFRRPLDDEWKQLYVDRLFLSDVAPEIAVKRSVMLVLKSPRFLYTEFPGQPVDRFSRASRLAWVMLDSLPDRELHRAAMAGELETREQIAAQARRLIDDPRARAKQLAFLMQWLRVDPAPDLSKDKSWCPDFDNAMAADLRTSLELTLQEFLQKEHADLRALMLSDTVMMNGRMARFYGIDLPGDAAFQPVQLDSASRAGVLTHPYLLASFAYAKDSSPIHRGVFIARSLLGRVLRPPPDAFTPAPAELHPDLTTRERVAAQTQPEACQKCHGLINPLGFPLETFDAVGRLRHVENNRMINATGSYQARTGELVNFDGPRSLALFLATSEEVQAAFVEKLFHAMVKQPIRAFGAESLDQLCGEFGQQDCDVKKLMVAMALLATSRETGP